MAKDPIVFITQSMTEAYQRYPERDDVMQWQKDQNEFFDPTILEIVTEYAEWRDKQNMQLEGVGWTSEEEIARCKKGKSGDFASTPFDEGSRDVARPVRLFKGPVATFKESEEEALIKRFITCLPTAKTNPKPRWSRFSKATGHGSGFSASFCRRYGFDPDELI